jgi:hypothetical protein
MYTRATGIGHGPPGGSLYQPLAKPGKVKRRDGIFGKRALPSPTCLDDAADGKPDTETKAPPDGQRAGSHGGRERKGDHAGTTRTATDGHSNRHGGERHSLEAGQENGRQTKPRKQGRADGGWRRAPATKRPPGGRQQEHE